MRWMDDSEMSASFRRERESKEEKDRSAYYQVFAERAYKDLCKIQKLSVQNKPENIARIKKITDLWLSAAKKMEEDFPNFLKV